MGLIPLKEYAQRHGKDPVVVRNKALRGSFETARKIGRQWFIDEDEPYGQTRSDQGYHRPEVMSLSGGIPEGMILLKEYAERNQLNPMVCAQVAEQGKFRTARKIGRQWFIEPDEPFAPVDGRVKSGKYIGFRERYGKKESDKN